MQPIKRLAYRAAAVIPVVALAACSSGGTSGPPPETSSIVLDVVPTVDAAGIYIAADDGYFARQGLNVKIVPIAEQKYGAVPLADFDQGSLQNFPIGTIAGNASWVRSHPNTVAAFLRALAQGQQVADTSRVAVEQALVRNGVAPSAEVAATMTLPTYPLFIDVPLMQRVPDSMYEFGVIGRPYDIAGMIAPESGEVR